MLPHTSVLPLLLGDSIAPLLIGSEAASSIWLLLLLIVAGMAAIAKGGDLFTDSSVDIARMTRIPPVIVGATIVSAATSFPEFMVSLTGTLSGSAEFAVGNAIGSCLCNIGLIVGLCAVTRGFLARRRDLKPGIQADRDMLGGAGSFMLASAVLVWVFSMFDAGGAIGNGQLSRFGLSRWQAVILVAFMFWYLAYSVRNARRARYEDSLNEDPDDAKTRGGSLMQWTKTSIAFLAATALVVIGSRLLVCNGEEIALRMGVPKLVLGLTLFAVGTSLPELTISMIAVLKGHEALGIGNIVGSNVLNICWVLATCAVIKPMPIAAQTVFVDLPVTLLLTILLIALPWKSERISTQAGWIMLGIYGTHLVSITLAGMNG
jgi:cation:H+ antiporter